MTGPAKDALILVVDNDAEMVALLAGHLEREGYPLVTATEGAAALQALEQEEYAVVLTDLRMEGVDGMALLRTIRERTPFTRVILMTAFGSLESAIEAMREGAFDYLTKPFKLQEVSLAVQRALDDRRLREENQRLRRAVEERYGLEALLGRSAAMEQVRELIRAVAPGEANVLLVGESGTGKELVARAIHYASPRAPGPFVPVNCAAIPEGLLEAELFGHERGAFTGADRSRPGLLAEAHVGSLFFDEVSDMPLALQAKVLRAIQEKTVRRVGGRGLVQLDFRIIAATNRDLAELVREGRFREDLYYRDIPLLAEHFLRRTAAEAGKRIEGFAEAARAWLLEHRWPGNVRELENTIERAVTLAKGSRITLDEIRPVQVPDLGGGGSRAGVNGDRPAAGKAAGDGGNHDAA
ncbi:MAG: sigma-54-dependent Fis family transcriptional regulator, partial [Candidatus Rokubacteria bacterium]|nr:sigma-54-dependent Fis family transcriptional regulator [Candidatus Rokubacteria bacterium]